MFRVGPLQYCDAYPDREAPIACRTERMLRPQFALYHATSWTLISFCSLVRATPAYCLLSATNCPQRSSANAAVDASEKRMPMDRTKAGRSEECRIITGFHLNLANDKATRIATLLNRSCSSFLV